MDKSHAIAITIDSSRNTKCSKLCQTIMMDHAARRDDDDDGNSSSGVKSLPLLYPFQMNEMVISVIKMMMVVA